ncbi:MAG TPA: Rossmann-like and DUF2520 domain-containing protein [Gemmatimonadota bacterium]|nr:Rossmann-like and DUF2520 domain-containing protein [Gemmatimonadota bacterium]
MDAHCWIVGSGRMGTAFATVLAGAGRELLIIGREDVEAGHPVRRLPRTRVVSRAPGPPADGTLVVLAISDAAIPAVAHELAGRGEPGAGCVALHLSGARPASILEPLARRGYATGSLHPLQTVADREHGAERLRGAFFTFEGDERARQPAADLVAAAGGRMLEVHAADKGRYHAACVFASNYVVACAAAATRLLADAVGVSREEAALALGPLWSGAVANLEQTGLPRALTGPIARGDLDTVRANLAALDSGTRALYARLGLEALALSRELGLDPVRAQEIEDALKGDPGEGTEEA